MVSAAWNKGQTIALPGPQFGWVPKLLTHFNINIYSRPLCQTFAFLFKSKANLPHKSQKSVFIRQKKKGLGLESLKVKQIGAGEGGGVSKGLMWNLNINIRRDTRELAIKCKYFIDKFRTSEREPFLACGRGLCLTLFFCVGGPVLGRIFWAVFDRTNGGLHDVVVCSSNKWVFGVSSKLSSSSNRAQRLNFDANSIAEHYVIRNPVIRKTRGSRLLLLLLAQFCVNDVVQVISVETLAAILPLPLPLPSYLCALITQTVNAATHTRAHDPAKCS